MAIHGSMIEIKDIVGRSRNGSLWGHGLKKCLFFCEQLNYMRQKGQMPNHWDWMLILIVSKQEIITTGQEAELSQPKTKKEKS